jgi:arylsulfatase A-like enzyme
MHLIIKMNRKKILLAALALLAVFGVLYCVYWMTLFFPDDIPLSIREAETRGPDVPSRVIDVSLADNVDCAVLFGNYSADAIAKLKSSLKKDGYLVKDDSFNRTRNRFMVCRAGTGFPGIWVDERSSIILPSNTGISFRVRAKKGACLEFSSLSLGGEGICGVEISSSEGTKRSEYNLASYRCAYTAKDARLHDVNRGYPRAKDDLGWREHTLDLSRYEGREISVTFTFSGSGTAFIGNPKILASSESRRYNVIYLVFDGVPTRLWSFYNERSGLTPFMKETAERDFIVFDNMFTLGDKTRISTTGLFCSAYPFMTRHGINRNFIPEKEIDLFYDMVRRGDIATLPDVFRRGGYTSAQFGNSGFTVQMLTTGIDYGFDRSYEFSFNPYGAYGISHRFFDFLRVNRNREFFAYLHYNTPHKPFHAPLSHYAKGVLRAPVESLWRPDFMACVSYSDEVFRSIYAALEAQGLLDNTIIVVATDHGATYDLSKFSKGFQYNDFTRMTFMIHLPDSLKRKLRADNRRIGTWISSINTAPTLCDLAGIEMPEKFMGKSFMPLLAGTHRGVMFDREIWSFGRKEFSVIDANLNKYILNYNEEVRFLDRKYIAFGEGREMPSERIFDLAHDQYEMNDLIVTRRDLLSKFRKRVLEFDPHHPEKNVLAFASDDRGRHRVTVRVRSKSPIAFAGLYTRDLREIPGLESSGSVLDRTYTFAIEKESVYFVLECDNDRSPVSFMMSVDGVPVARENIFTTYLNLNTAGNPVELKERDDFMALNDTNLPDARQLRFFGRKGITVKVLRLDLHRWIDIGRLEMRGISAGMKETLRSWGYIQ